jgi:hypothetical protein
MLIPLEADNIDLLTSRLFFLFAHFDVFGFSEVWTFNTPRSSVVVVVGTCWWCAVY